MSRSQRIQDLKTAADQYIQQEKTRVENEVQALEAILNGRTGGAGIQQVSVKVVAAVADKDLASYLKGA